jgi:O-antigen/teichoic acid export membrane protein
MAADPSINRAQRLAAWAAHQRTRLPAPVRALGQRTGTLALIDQALVSGINFVTAVVVARSLAPTSYGYYALLFAALLLINGLQTALITAPLMVIGPRQDAEQHAGYINSLWVVQLAGCLIAGIAVIGLMLIWRYVAGSSAAPVSMPAVLVVLIGYLAQEFVRRALFCKRDSLGGIGSDIISYGGQLLAILGLIAFQQLTLETVLWAMGLTSLAACVFGGARMRLTLRAVRRADIFSTWSNHWEYGRWLVSSNLANWGASQFYIFVVAALLSPAATGLFAAGRTLLGFTNPFLLGLENFVPATMTRRLINQGVDALEHWTNRFRLFSLALVGAYCLIAALFADPLVQLLFGSNYSGAGLVVPIIALGYVIISASRPTMLALRALGAPRWSFFANAIAALVSIVIAFPLVQFGGIIGAALGMLATNVIALVVGSIGYRREVRAYRLAAATAGSTQGSAHG